MSKLYVHTFAKWCPLHTTFAHKQLLRSGTQGTHCQHFHSARRTCPYDGELWRDLKFENARTPSSRKLWRIPLRRVDTAEEKNREG